MAAFLGSLEYVLEEGAAQRLVRGLDHYFFAVVSALCRRRVLLRAFTARQPIVDLRAFADRNFALGSMFSFVLGVGLYGLTYLYPLYLARIRGYDALMIGETMFVSGVAMFVCAPIVGRLMDKVDPRLMLLFGFRDVRCRFLADDLRHQGLRFLGAVRAADPARRRPDVRDGADHQRGARHARAGAR